MKPSSLCYIAMAGVLMVGLTTGCASKNSRKTVTLPAISKPIAGTPKASVRIAPFHDNRPLYDKSVVAKQRNGYGHTTSAVVAAQEPLAELLYNGVVQSLEQSNFPVAQRNGLYQLRGAIRSFDLQPVTEFWNATGRSKLEVQFELVNTISGASVWQKNYIGDAALTTPWSRNDLAAKMFSESAADCVQQLLADQTFRGYFEGKN